MVLRPHEIVMAANAVMLPWLPGAWMVAYMEAASRRLLEVQQRHLPILAGMMQDAMVGAFTDSGAHAPAARLPDRRRLQER